MRASFDELASNDLLVLFVSVCVSRQRASGGRSEDQPASDTDGKKKKKAAAEEDAAEEDDSESESGDDSDDSDDSNASSEGSSDSDSESEIEKPAAKKLTKKTAPVDTDPKSLAGMAHEEGGQSNVKQSFDTPWTQQESKLYFGPEHCSPTKYCWPISILK